MISNTTKLLAQHKYIYAQEALLFGIKGTYFGNNTPSVDGNIAKRCTMLGLALCVIGLGARVSVGKVNIGVAACLK